MIIHPMTPDDFRKTRLAGNRSQAQLAKDLGMSIRQITRIETGRAPVRRVTAVALQSLRKKAKPPGAAPPRPTN